MEKYRSSREIPYIYKEMIEREKESLKKRAFAEVAERLEENKKYAIEIKTTVTDKRDGIGYSVAVEITLTEVQQREIEFASSQGILQPVQIPRKSILQRIKEKITRRRKW